ncbi:MAG: DUF2029 domain-containing protein [Phycisphaerae bacterium]|nr:DUF2029 domain-containing protein [Phycisphaerae bacterium]
MTELPGQVCADGRGQVRRGLVAFLVAGLCGVVLLGVDLPRAFSPAGQWDFETYYYAVRVLDAGGNPWDHAELVKAAGGAVHHFIYPPHMFAFFRLFASGDLARGKDLYLAAKLACLAALLALWLAYFVRPGFRGWFLAFAVLGFDTTICRDLVTGNVSLFEQTLIWFGVFALLRGRLWAFCLLIILAAQFKILPVCLLGLVVLTDRPRKVWYLAGSIAVCVLLAGGVYVSDPEAARTWFSLATEVGSMEPGGTINPCAMAAIREAAGEVMTRWSALHGMSLRSVANGMYGIYAVVILLVFAWFVRGRRDLRIVAYLGILTYVLIAPRMKDYSYIIALVPTFELILRRMHRPAGSDRLLVFVVAAMLALPLAGVLWGYRSLVLAGWAWAISLKLDKAGDESGSVSRIS